MTMVSPDMIWHTAEDGSLTYAEGCTAKVVAGTVKMAKCRVLEAGDSAMWDGS